MPSLVCFLNKVDAVDDPELLELVEMELRGGYLLRLLFQLTAISFFWNIYVFHNSCTQ